MSRARLTIPLPPVWLLSNLVVLALVAGFLWLDKEQLHWYAPESAGPSAVESDRVVGIEIRCDLFENSSWHELWGRYCVDTFTVESPAASDGSLATFRNAPSGAPYAASRRQVVTVRTAQGTTYTVETPIKQSVKVGDPWPPK